MNSCLYECRVMHHRFSPRVHGFSYRLFMFALDLDELPALSRRLRWFSVLRPNLYSFRDSDYLPTGEPAHHPSEKCHIISDTSLALKDRVVAHLAGRGLDLTGGRVLLVTLPRVAGYLFNPVSFYFCYDRAAEPVAALAEVTNTFREMKPFVLGPETRALRGADTPRDDSATFRLRTPKYFYVSPFSAVEVAFDFALRTPSTRLAVQIDDYDAGHRTLTSTLTGERTELTDRNLAWFTLKYPLLTLRVIALIHWHALQLWWKKVPWFPKAAHPAGQRDLYRPHASIAGADARLDPAPSASSTSPFA
ncbi:MAG: DUF1365 domain-containing protein [Opitutae bacterium]|nr:DUF1365 domain-containing protein [Opitutae bacterium]